VEFSSLDEIRKTTKNEIKNAAAGVEREEYFNIAELVGSGARFSFLSICLALWTRPPKAPLGHTIMGLFRRVLAAVLSAV